MSPIHEAGALVIQTLIDLYLIALMLRFFFQLVRADFFNPISQFIVKLTNPLLIPLRRIIPGLFGIDFACLFLMLVLAYFKLGALFWLQMTRLPDPLGLFVWTAGDLIKLSLYVFLFAIVIQAVMSWLSGGRQHPAQMILAQLTSPLLRPFSRFIPSIGGIDITPIFALITLQVMLILVANPVTQFGIVLAQSVR